MTLCPINCLEMMIALKSTPDPTQIKYNYFYWKEFLTKEECVTSGRLLLEFSSGSPRQDCEIADSTAELVAGSESPAQVLGVLGDCFIFRWECWSGHNWHIGSYWIEAGKKIIRNPWAISERAFNSLSLKKTEQFSFQNVSTLYSQPIKHNPHSSN